MLATERKDFEFRMAEKDRTVFFHGDGEPRSHKDMLNALFEFEQEIGFEADSYSRGGNVEELEEIHAQTLGKEAAIFMPTGTLANHLAIRRHCGNKPRAVVQEQSHMYNDTGDCASQLSGINLVPLAKDRPYFSLEDLQKVVRLTETGRVSNPIGVVSIESPIRRQAGQIVPFDEMKAITAYCRQSEIKSHLDGARLYMMSVATGISPLDYASLFDSVYVSLYKYFGAPFGAILVGDTSFIEGLYHDRRMFGGGLASANFAAALALRGINGFEGRFAHAMSRAQELFRNINLLDGVSIKPFPHGSNIFPLTFSTNVDQERFRMALQARSVFISSTTRDDGSLMLTVNTTILRRSAGELLQAFEFAIKQSKNE